MQEHDLVLGPHRDGAGAAGARRANAGSAAWLRKNLFASVGDTILTIIGLAARRSASCRRSSNWAFINAAVDRDRTAPSARRSRRAASSPTAGPAPAGPSSAPSSGQFMFGRYPLDERWRVDPGRHPVRGAAGAAADPARAAQGAERDPASSSCFPIVAFFLLVGGYVRPAACRDRAAGAACW